MRRKRRGGHKPDGTLGFGLRSQHGGEDELVGEAATVASALWGWIGLRLEGDFLEYTKRPKGGI